MKRARVISQIKAFLTFGSIAAWLAYLFCSGITHR